VESVVELAVDILLDAAKDTLLIVPFLLVTYLIMEWLEHKTSARTIEKVRKAGVAGPAFGAVFGLLPQCGFSSAASTFYAGRVITLGTLIAVYLSTSDEMLPIFIAEQVNPQTILAILATKMVIGLAAGFAIDAIMRATHREPRQFQIDELCEAADCACDEECAQEPSEHHALGHDHHEYHEHHEHGAGSILKSACKHTLQVTLFVFVIALVLDFVLEVMGEDVLADFVASNEALSVFSAALVGLIPNCAASVTVAQLYVNGVLGSGAMMAGLLVSAGVGLLILCRTNRHALENVLIIALLYAIGVVAGLVINLCGIVF